MIKWCKERKRVKTIKHRMSKINYLIMQYMHGGRDYMNKALREDVLSTLEDQYLESYTMLHTGERITDDLP